METTFEEIKAAKPDSRTATNIYPNIADAGTHYVTLVRKNVNGVYYLIPMIWKKTPNADPEEEKNAIIIDGASIQKYGQVTAERSITDQNQEPEQ